MTALVLLQFCQVEFQICQCLFLQEGHVKCDILKPSDYHLLPALSFPSKPCLCARHTVASKNGGFSFPNVSTQAE